MRLKLVTYGGAVLVALAGLVVALAISQDAGATNQKVTICHVPPGNPENAHTITISQAALQAHLGDNPQGLHGGDYYGPCETPENPPPPPPPPPGPPPASPPPPPSVTCDHSVMGGKDGNPGNDDCVPDSTPPPPRIDPPTPAPPPALTCPEGYTQQGATSVQVLCVKTETVMRTVTKTKVRVKTVVKRVPSKPRIVFKKFCPKPYEPGKLAG